ncbi:aminotransferase class I/II-fold pyridoxal phosphate-dependent enzyme [Acanthopleuribacter pedis]|uniref:Aminotransferase class I/II-fold pyridoxal phosphate-dependent enzyme n=1 Tax=Acanthopleuribacter pedis TaxID=442870 RepID=A0A8J7QDV1_9BACT|nr:aminotransferase class I/II-fold pyridoxal phosphate-dependent enzyme [Acanthopleuribacter pedis]MBO1322344.1 aminotransferase class I/II-fold pyridoxal phosphate-dependent enzyme [Acanthopleuribacter pedis]
MTTNNISDLQARFDALKAQNLNLDMTRGKPAPEQLDLANAMLTIVDADSARSEAGTDCRNYGVVDGLPAAKAFFGEFLEAPAEQVFIGGNASLTLMHNTVMRAMLFGVPGSPRPWCKEPVVRWLCPVPGYDRHFNICREMGMEMISVPMNDEGPDMDRVAALAASDETIKGIWCVPKYSNPTGITYSDAVVDRLASMKTAAPDFRILWDNAYAHHPLYAENDSVKNILTACDAAGNPDRVYHFGSTSKITFAGSGVSAVATSPANHADLIKHVKMETIGHDKLNQLRHLRFLKDMDGLKQHMQKHADIMRPKFEKVVAILERDLADTPGVRWTTPRGGYFITLETAPGTAKRVVELAASLGVKLTPAGATHPNGHDPEDRTIRIAPSLPSLPAIEQATTVMALCVKLATAEKG